MYIVMSGEVEVSEKRLTGNPEDPVEIIRLGFLSEGAFFGEAPLLGLTETSLELRTRTVTAVRSCEVCFLTRDAVTSLYGSYPELQARMMRFASSGRVLDERSLQKLDLSRPDIEEFSKEYKDQLKLAHQIREKNNLEEGVFVPEHLVKSFTVRTP